MGYCYYHHHQFFVLSIMKLVCVVLTLSAVTAVLPLSMGCSLETTEPIIRCRSNNLDYIIKSMYILAPENRNANGSVDNRTIHIQPTEVDIFYCEVPELSNIFQRFNASLEKIRVARSNVKGVSINAFEGLENKLRYLDLSGNKLLVVPAAIQNLTRLEILNLRDNKIRVLAYGPTFSYTKNLREIYLDFNELGSLDIIHIYPQSKNNNRKSNQQTPIGLGLFSLGNTTSTLEVLSLRGNNMHSYPEQFLSDFPHLKSLDLSFNSIVELPEDAFRTMPELQTVNVDANFIRTIKFSSLPETLKVFTLKNNPLRCDCDVKWLLERIFTNTSLQFVLPKCNAPFHLRDTSFLSLTVDKLCNQSHIRRQTVYVNDRDLSYFPQGVFQSLKLLEVRGGGLTSVYVLWKVDAQFYLSQREWLIIYRKLDDSIYTFNRTLFASKSYGENQTEWNPAERVFNDNIKNLTAGTFYQICLSVVENNINYVHLNNCRVTQTEKEVLPPAFPTVEPVHDPHDQTTTPAPDPDILIESNLVRIRADVRSITVYWNVFVRTRESRAFYKDHSKKDDNGTTTKMEFTPESPLVVNTLTAIYNELKWKIEYRKFATEATTAVTIMKNNYVVTGPNTHQYTIANLKAGTGYMVCFETINDLSNKGRQLLESVEKEGSSPKHVSLDSNGTVCKEIETLNEKKLPVTEMAISSTITAGVTVVVVTLLFCILPRIFKTKRKSEDDAENASQNTVHTDPENDDDDDDEEDEDLDSDEDPRNSYNKSNGHLPKGKNSYPKLANIFPIEDYRNGSYHSSFRAFSTGMPSHPGSQRNGTYPKSILKKSPSAPQLSEAVRPPPILKRPSSVHDDQSNRSSDSNDNIKVSNVIEMDKNRNLNEDKTHNHKESAVEMMKIFSPPQPAPKTSDFNGESESPS